MRRLALLFLSLSLSLAYSFGQGSRILAPNYPGTAALDAPNATPSVDNDDFAWLEHDGFGGANDNFLDPSAPAAERLYVRIRNGETLYWGLRRIPVRYQVGVAYSAATIEHTNHEDLTVVIRENDGTLAQSTLLTNNAGSTAGATLNPANGVIETVAESLLGPEFIFNATTINSGGYSPVSYTNNTGSDQDFYIEFIQDDGGTTDINQRSWYDLWDFTVYNGNEEKSGRLFCQRWSFTAQHFLNRLSDDFKMYIRVPSTIGGVNSGSYIKQLDIGGLDPFSLVLYANSEGSDGTGGDTNGDGVTDFQDFRQGQTTDIGYEEYDVFIQNPDIDIWPTTTLPSINITDAVIYCNASGTGGEASITIETNQVGYAAIIIDLNGVGGYQAGTTDVIIEAEIANEGSQTIRWDGLNGLGATVASGTPIIVSGRFTSGPIHVPMYDVEESTLGINMLDVRPSTSFDLIYWDDSSLGNTGASPESELDGTNVDTHLWNDDGGNNGGDENLINTWSFGYYEVNTQNINFTYTCDEDGDGVTGSGDLDSDNDGIANSVEGDHYADADADGIPNYLDSDFAGYTDVNGDGVNDNFDADQDGIPDALDVDSDNDGIPDLVENGLTDADLDGTLDEGSGITDSNNNGLDDTYDPDCDGSLTAYYGASIDDENGVNAANPATNALGSPNGNYAELDDEDDFITINLGNLVLSGTDILINMQHIDPYQNSPSTTCLISQSDDGATFVNEDNFTVTTTAAEFTYTLTSDANFIRILNDNSASPFGTAYDLGVYYINYEVQNCSGGAALTIFDTDSDGIDNYLDLDSDNDGIVDAIEAGGTADSATGRIANYTDSNGNGLNDDQENIALTIPDSDGDGIRNYLDIDSDNDGLTDNIEGQVSSNYLTFSTTDANGNGLYDTYDPNNGGTLLTPVNTDADANPDYIDTDSDSDGVFDFIEGWDSNRDGYSDLDTDNSGTLTDADACGAYSSPGLLRTENADFENGLQGLTTFFGDIQVTNNSSSGDAAIISGPAEGGSTISDFIPITEGETFTLTGQAFVTGAVGYTAIGLTFWDETKTTRLSEPQQEITNTGGYAGFTVPNETAPVGSAFVEVWSYKGGTTGTLTFDDFSLVNTGACAGTYTTDSDGDGLYDIYEPYNSPIQNTDNAGEADWQDADDDNDGSLTSGEDINGNNNWADDFTQGGVVIPDYLFRGDFDGDGIVESVDFDSDNDGILDTTEANGETTNPSEDADGDGTLNYQDAGIAGTLSDASDVNGDGVYDVYDSDLDGIPDFLDLDSDNDGLWDAIEADGGSVPNGLNITTGQFALQDPDNDGLMNYVDTNDAAFGGVSDLANPDTDGDGLKDYIDIDSDGDGITDIIETQTEDGFIGLTYLDEDGDGIDDAFDPSSGGVLLDPLNSDGLDDLDYLDSDSDNDGVTDANEGDDADQDGYGDWDANTNHIVDDAGFDTDSDGDGLADIFDTVTRGTAGNETGSNANLPNTDAIDTRNWRDGDDDNDGIPTEDEDANGNGNLADDQTGGQSGNIPDYLYYGDYDGDGISDEDDGDSDNDGIPDAQENGGEAVNPSADADGDGIPNYKDPDDPGLSSTVDSNGDGVYDVYDADLDGIPDFRDRDADNDGTPDLVEAGGVDADGNGEVDCYDSFYLEAECYSYGGNWDSIADAGASGGSFVEFPTGTSTGSAPTATADRISFSFDVCTAGSYEIYFLVRAASGANDSFWVRTNDDVWIQFNNIAQDATNFIWDQVHDSQNGNTAVSFDLVEGQNTLDIAYRENNTELDKIHVALTGSVPTGNSQETINCIIPIDSDGDGKADIYDLDSDNDGITDLVETGGIDADGDGKLDDLTDSDLDGFPDLVDSDNGGTALSRPDSDNDGVLDFLDLDSDNDGIPDAVDNGGIDSNNDGRIDNWSNDTDGDGLADVVDPDSGGTPISNADTDGDGLADYLDLDADNDGLPDILEAGGTDADNDGIVDNTVNSDPGEDTIPDNVDVDNSGANGGSGADVDGDEIDDSFDIDFTGGTDTDGDGIDDAFDTDANGDGFDDDAKANPYGQEDKEGDGFKDFRDLDSDGDGIVDVIELGFTADAGTGSISGFTDANNNGWNDTQDGTLVTPTDTDSDGIPDYQDIDADNDGIPDNIEGQTKATYVAISDVDTDADGLDDVYDPNNGGALVALPNSDGTGNADYLDTDSDDDTVPDNIEGDNDDRSQYADWDTNSNNDITDETGYNLDTDSDGLWDIFDTDSGNNSSNVTGSNSNGMDTDRDGNWDFQDADDDGDGTTTANEDTGTANSDPTDDFTAGGTPIPDYLYGNPDADGDTINDDSDADSDNDGVVDTSEDGGTGIDPSGDIDADGILNAFDEDMDGDGIPNESDADADGDLTADPIRLTDTNNDEIPDELDRDLDGVPDFIDLDSDNDGIADVIEIGLSDANEDGTLDEGSGITDVNSNGLADANDPACDGSPIVTPNYATSVFDNNGMVNTANALGAPDGTYAATNANGEYMTVQFGQTIPSGTDVFFNVAIDGDFNITFFQSINGTVFTNQVQTSTTAETVPTDYAYTLNADADYIRFRADGGTERHLYHIYFNTSVSCTGGVGVTIPDTDSDGIDDYLDLDSDNDGIPDNVEAQLTASYVAPAAGDTDGDGILDVYDEDISAGNAIDPENTDGADTDDYIDTDSDNDGVLDFVEAFDADMNGFSSLDLDEDGLISDQSGYNSDSDKDGILLIFDNSNGRGTIANITGTRTDRQDTDGDSIEDWRDLDDDGDGTDTGDGSAGSGEDINANGNWADDFTQGGGTTPNYLYNADTDGDGVADDVDFDSDNDGILNADEVASDLPSPFGDEDLDGIYNYLDVDNTGFSDVNGDGVDDQYDQDRDGIPNFLDLDSDNDGIADIIEAGLTDADVDGQVDSFDDSADSNGYEDTFTLTGGTVVDFNGATNPTNADGLPNGTDARINAAGEYLTFDLGDSYPAGTAIAVALFKPNGTSGSITFQIGQSTASGGSFTNNQVSTPSNTSDFGSYFIVLDAAAQYIKIELTARSASGGRVEVDGIYFNTNTPPDTDADGVLADFLDIDSDNDGLTDHLEAQTTASLTNPSGVDTDEDGLDDAFDGDNGGTALSPINTDGTDNPDYLDTDSDNDNDGDGTLFDYIEGYDANRNGFSELDSDADGDLSDESGYNVDTDGDGLWDLFDSYSGRGTSNITGSRANVQDTDSDGIVDFRDQDDDGDALTTAVEDNDNDGDWTNDKTQGGGATPDYLYFNDTDGDRIADGLDQDGDNDGILDDDEYDNTTYRDPFGDQDGDGIYNYTDSDDPTDLGGGALTDSNGDGIWDAYDWDLDGTPNFFDLDNDNDGIPDIIEAGGTDANNDGIIDGIVDSDGDGLFDNVDVDATGGTDSDLDGIDDNFDFSVSGGTDTDGDDIIDSADFDDDGDGIINVIDADEGGTPHPNPDTDGDGVRNIFDYDSDNDGILDIVEAGGADSNGDGKLDSFGDTDGDGWGNSRDSDNGGTAHPMYDSDSDLTEDYIQIDADSEGTNDWGEGFDDDEDGGYLDDYEVRRVSYETANGDPGHYPTTDVGPANGTPDYLDDADADGTPNFLDTDNATYFRDSDSDGIVDFFDPSNNGTRYAGVSGAPDNDGDGLPNYRDDSFASPLPLDWISFEATYMKGDVDLIWVTTNEVDVSHFDIEHSIDGESFTTISRLEANNLSGINTYRSTHSSPVLGINYYRLNQVDFDGRSEYSWMRAITATNSKISFLVYPNPTKESITIQTEAIVTGSVELIDIQGRVLMTKEFKGTNSTTIDLDELTSGLYQLRITTPNGVVYKRVVKR